MAEPLAWATSTIFMGRKSVSHFSALIFISLAKDDYQEVGVELDASAVEATL